MPNCADNFENEIENGKNVKSVKCKFCSSKILNPTSAEFTNSEFSLPLMRQKKSENSIESETISLFWVVNDMYTFENVGFSNTVGNTKYLICADCEAGPIGYHDIATRKSYVALTRVQHI